MILAWNLVTKHLSPHAQLQAKIHQKISKLEQHLQHFPPDAVHLLVHLERHPKREDFTAALTLHLPSNVLHSQKSASDPIPAFDHAIKALLRELATLKADLRHERDWKRLKSRGEAVRKAARFPEQPATAGPQSLADTLALMIQRYHGRLLYFVQRQLWRDQLNDNVPRGAVDALVVVDEIVRQALAAPWKKPDELSYRLWLFALTKRELRRRLRLLQKQEAENVPIDDTTLVAEDRQAAEGYDAEQPLQIIEENLEPPVAQLADLLPDTRAERPDEVAGEHDLVDFLHRAAESWPEKERAVFDLHFLQGFDEDEVAMLENVPRAEARQLVSTVQMRLRELLVQATERWVSVRGKSLSAKQGESPPKAISSRKGA